jgi:hypothetical protein
MPRHGLGEDDSEREFRGAGSAGAGAGAEADLAADADADRNDGDGGDDDEELMEEVAAGVYKPVRERDPVEMLAKQNEAAAAAAALAPERGGNYMGDGWTFFTGSTLGEVRLYDLRAAKVAQRVRISMRRGFQATFHGGGPPITGIQPNFAHDRFCTSSFDGCVRVWDLRTFRPVQILRAAAEERLARLDITRTLAAAGGMDGTLHIFDFLAELRAEALGDDV